MPKMILGFSDRNRSGMICRAIRACSRVKEGIMLLIWCVCLPHCVVISIYKE